MIWLKIQPQQWCWQIPGQAESCLKLDTDSGWEGGVITNRVAWSAALDKWEKALPPVWRWLAGRLWPLRITLPAGLWPAQRLMWQQECWRKGWWLRFFDNESWQQTTFYWGKQGMVLWLPNQEAHYWPELGQDALLRAVAARAAAEQWQVRVEDLLNAGIRTAIPVRVNGKAKDVVMPERLTQPAWKTWEEALRRRLATVRWQTSRLHRPLLMGDAWEKLPPMNWLPPWQEERS